MANSRDFTGKNRKFTGTKGITTPKGTTGQRVGSESGELRFNTTTELMEYYDGNAWKPIDAPPSISSITTSDSVGTSTILNADGSTLHTITINGGNFGVGVNVQFIGSTGTTYTAGNITRVAGSQITCKTTASMGTTDDPYDVKVTNVSGLSIESLDAFSFNAPPVFTRASGTLGEIWNGRVTSGTTLNAGATDAEGNTITFSIISGSLPGSGLTLSSSTGAITGTLGGSPSLGNYPFVVRASTTEGVVERQFSIQVIAVPTVAFDFLVIGGGGGGGSSYGGGGGAGGFRTSTQTLNKDTEITITVGDGGGTATQGSSSSISGSGVSTITSAGGGYGNPAGAPGGNGGSGGGGGGDGGPSAPSSNGGSGNTPSTSPSQGNNGGTGFGQDGYGPGGGGGGAGAAGTGGANRKAGNGGNGTANSITGSSVTRAGGGGGGIVASAPGDAVRGDGGTGGGGNGGGSGTPGTTGSDGVANTGGGGGSGGYWPASPAPPGHSGGKGVVILSMPDAGYSGTTTGSPTVATGVAGKTILTFTGSGSYTV